HALPSSTRLPYTTLFRSRSAGGRATGAGSSSHSSIPDSFATRSRGRFGMVVEIPQWFFTAFLSVFGLGMGGIIAVIGFFARRLVDRKSTRLNSSHVQISY